MAFLLLKMFATPLINPKEDILGSLTAEAMVVSEVFLTGLNPGVSLQNRTGLLNIIILWVSLQNRTGLFNIIILWVSLQNRTGLLNIIILLVLPTK